MLSGKLVKNIGEADYSKVKVNAPIRAVHACIWHMSKPVAGCKCIVITKEKLCSNTKLGSEIELWTLFMDMLRSVYKTKADLNIGGNPGGKLYRVAEGKRTANFRIGAWACNKICKWFYNKLKVGFGCFYVQFFSNGINIQTELKKQWHYFIVIILFV